MARTGVAVAHRRLWSQLLSRDLDGGAGAAVLGGPGSLLEPVDDHAAGPLMTIPLHSGPPEAARIGQRSECYSGHRLDQIARNREEYFSGRGESPGRFVGSAAATASLEGIASPEQVRAMFQGLDPATGEQRCAPLWRADPRSKLAAGPLLAALNTRGAGRGRAGGAGRLEGAPG